MTNSSDVIHNLHHALANLTLIQLPTDDAVASFFAVMQRLVSQKDASRDGVLLGVLWLYEQKGDVIKVSIAMVIVNVCNYTHSFRWFQFRLACIKCVHASLL